MKTLLAVCPACMRHIRVTEVRCPFCGSNIPSSFREQEVPAPVGRLSRAALFALRAGALSMTAAACGGAVAGGTEPESTSSASSGRESTSSASSGMFFVLYGGAPPGPVEAPDASVAALYGAFIGEDAGPPDADGGETVVALYGGFYAPDASPPDGTADADADAAPKDASEDHFSIAPAYGLPVRSP